MEYTIELNEEEIRRVHELVAICKKMQGEYVSDLNIGWATSYSTEFSDAATELIKHPAASSGVLTALSKPLAFASLRPKGRRIYSERFKIYSQRSKISPPIRYSGTRNFITVICDLIAELFSSNGIRSCRGSAMDRENMRYLFDAYILKKHNHQ